MKQIKKLTAVLVAILLLVSIIPLGTFTASAATSGTTGECTWTLDGTTLTIGGNGKMANYKYSSAVPWGRTITKVVINNGVTSIGDYAFYLCESLTSITIPDSVTSIGDSAFEYCDSLVNITIPDSVTSIGDEAFFHCESLTSITIPDSVTSIGDCVFEHCTKLTSITVDENNPVYHSSGNCIIKTESKELVAGCNNSTIPDDGSVTSIGNYAFCGCISLTSITIPDGVTSIGSYAFNDCIGLTSITIPDSVTSIGNHAFNWCCVLTSITIPDSVTSIGNRAFCNCSSLTSITIPESVTSIGDYAFWSCDGLKSITIPDSVTSIGIWAFSYCDSLVNITIPDSVTSIGIWAFSYCDSLVNITIPDSVTSIGDWAFSYCESLTDVWYKGSETDRANITIGSNNEPLISATWHYNTCDADKHKYDNPSDTTCNNCEWVREALPELSFKSASLSLQSNLAFNFKVDSALFGEGKYENPYVVFQLKGKKTKVENYIDDGDRYVFTLKGITPDKMKDTVTATLYATYEGVEYTAVKEYSIKEYCYNMLSQFAENTSLRTLIVDLLNYGAASQMYSGYNTDNLVNADLTAEQSSWGSTDATLNDALNTKFETVDNATAHWKGAGITLLESVAMRLQFRAESINGLSVRITTSTNEWIIQSNDFKKEGDYYYVMFDKLGANKMSEEVYLTVMKDGKKVSNTAKYSIESYAYAKQNDSDSNLANLVKTMMRYGNSAKKYNG